MHQDIIIAELPRSCRSKRPPGSPAAWALEAGNHRAALSILNRRDALSWREASECASLALGRSARVLAAVLDRAPQDDPLFCFRRYQTHGGDCSVICCTGLLSSAAALDDLDAVDLLLERGEAPAFTSFRLSPHFYELAGIPSNVLDLSLDTIQRQYFGGGSAADLAPAIELEEPDPLAAAVFCGARRCALRLAELCRSPSPACRRALISAFLAGGALRETAGAVAAAWGAELPDLLEAGDFAQQPGGPLLPEFLRRNPGAVLPSRTVSALLAASSLPNGSQDCWDALERMDPAAFTAALAQYMSRHPSRFQLWEDNYRRNLPEHPELRLVLDRNAAPFELRPDLLSFLLDRAQIVGTPPEGGLSGLAASLLDAMVLQARHCRRFYQNAKLLIYNPKARGALLAEDHRMLALYLCRKRGQAEESDIHIMMSLLGIREERNYEL